MNNKGPLIQHKVKLDGGIEIPNFQYAKLSEQQYLIIVDRIFNKDPIRQHYAIVNKKKFDKLINYVDTK